MGRRIVPALAVTALFLLPIGHCMSAMAMDEGAMQCCHSMPCTPANGQGCCKNMVSAQTPNMLPGQHVSLHAPIVAHVEYPRLNEVLEHSRNPWVTVNAQQHSPPELYTLHASLLI
jgi:hypothetical protein